MRDCIANLSVWLLVLTPFFLSCTNQGDAVSQAGETAIQGRPSEEDEVLIGYIIKGGSLTVSTQKLPLGLYSVQAPPGTIQALGTGSVEKLELSVWGVTANEFDSLGTVNEGFYSFQTAIPLGSLFPSPNGSLGGTFSTSATFESLVITVARQEDIGFVVLPNRDKFSTAYGSRNFSEIILSSRGQSSTVSLQSVFSPMNMEPPPPAEAAASPPPPPPAQVIDTPETFPCQGNISITANTWYGQLEIQRVAGTDTAFSGRVTFPPQPNGGPYDDSVTGTCSNGSITLKRFNPQQTQDWTGTYSSTESGVSFSGLVHVGEVFYGSWTGTKK